MKDQLQDLIQHTYGLQVIELVKITGSDKETQIAAVADNKSLILEGSFKNPISDFIGTFGMPNLNKLKTILGFDDYDEHSKINVTRNQDKVPTNIHFETKAGDFVNDYRLMSQVIIEEKVKTVKYNGTTWNIEFEPTISGITRLKKQASANSEEEHFTMKTENNDLKIYFGDVSTHNGNFVFQPQVRGAMSRPLMWPVKIFISILDLPGDKTIKINDKGAMEITVDSGIATYRYLLPAHSK